MTNKFLLNLLGFNPDLTSRQPRVDSLSLVSRQSDLLTHLGRITAILVLVLTIGVGNAWGAAVPSQAPANGKSFIIALYYNNKYYALPHLSSTGSTPAGLECTLNASNKVTAISTCDSPDECLWDFATASGGFYISYDNEGTEVYLYKNGTTGDNYKISATSSYKSNSIWAFTSGTANSVTAYSVKTTKSTATKHTVLQAKSNTSFQVSGTSNVYAITLLEVAATGPTITTSVSSLTEVGYSTADFSQQVKSFTVSGSSLTANVTVTAPTNYEVCKTSGGTYTSSVSFDKGSGTLAASTVYVRLQSGKTAGSYSGDVACTSDGATTKNVAVSGSVPFTVTWKANGTTHATTYVAYATSPGTALGSLPDDPDAGDYCGDVFYGWYDGASYSHASVAPSIIGTSTKITSDKTYVAVFADEEDGGTTTVYKLVSSLTNAKDYVFVTRNTAGSGYALSSSVTTGTSVTITTSGDDKIVSGTPANTIIWTAATGWNLQNKNTSTYLVINGSSFSLNASAGTLYWSTDYGLYGKSGSGKTSYYVQCSTGTFSKSESGSTTNRVWAYEKTTVSVKTHTNFKTTCCTKLGSINGSFS